MFDSLIYANAPQKLRTWLGDGEALFNHVPHFCFVINGLGSVQGVSRFTLTQLDYEPTMVLGRPFTTLSHADDRVLLTRLIAEIQADSSVPRSWKARLLTRSGSVRWVHGNAQALPNLDHAVLLSGQENLERDWAALTNVAKSAQATTEAVDSVIGMRFFDALVEHLVRMLGVEHAFIADVSLNKPTDLRIVAWHTDKTPSPITERRLPGPLCDYVMQRGAVCIPKDAATHLAPIVPAVDRDINGFAAVPLTDSNHRATGVLGVCSKRSLVDPTTVDATLKLFVARASAELERKRADDVLRDRENTLLQLEKLQALGQLAGGIAHDFNNLLTAINGYAQMSLRTLPANSPTRRDIAEILRAGKRAAELTRQLLAFSRRSLSVPRRIHPSKLIRTLQPMLRRLIREDIELVLNLDADAGLVLIDPQDLERVVLNLCVNASDAMPHGGRLVIEVKNQRLEAPQAKDFGDLKPGPYVQLTVCDTGVGIPPEARQHLFEPFFTTKEVGRGTGLGLAMCYGLIKQNGGHITVESKLQVGTTFTILLQRADGPEQDSSVMPPTARLPHGTEAVLIVEDDAQVRTFAVRALAEQGYRLYQVENGMAALNLLTQENGPTIDLLLTDIVMPQLGGFELWERLMKVKPGLKVLFTSAYPDRLTAQNRGEYADLPFIAKPFSVEALAFKVREILDAPKLHRAPT